MGTAKAVRCTDRVTEIPDVVVEVVSVDSRNYDLQTKKADYERSGVSEYWVVDPQRSAFYFYRLQQGKFVETAPVSDEYSSQAIAGFKLNLAKLRKLFP